MNKEAYQLRPGDRVLIPAVITALVDASQTIDLQLRLPDGSMCYLVDADLIRQDGLIVVQ